MDLVNVNLYKGDPDKMIDQNFNLKILELLSESSKTKVYKCFVKETW